MATLASECPTYFDFSSAKLFTKFIFEFLFYIVAWISERVLIVSILFYLYKKGGDFFRHKSTIIYKVLQSMSLASVTVA